MLIQPGTMIWLGKALVYSQPPTEQSYRWHETCGGPEIFSKRHVYTGRNNNLRRHK